MPIDRLAKWCEAKNIIKQGNLQVPTLVDRKNQNETYTCKLKHQSNFPELFYFYHIPFAQYMEINHSKDVQVQSCKRVIT